MHTSEWFRAGHDAEVAMRFALRRLLAVILSLSGLYQCSPVLCMPDDPGSCPTEVAPSVDTSRVDGNQNQPEGPIGKVRD